MDGTNDHMTENASQRAVADVDRVAEAIWRNDPFRMGDPDKWTASDDQHAYVTMAEAAIKALGIYEEKYRSAMCPDDRDYDMVRLCSNWKAIESSANTQTDSETPCYDCTCVGFHTVDCRATDDVRARR